ncbi:MAG: hypothetical protein Q4B58_02845 [Bacteroidales bacterium]|nr:hypothetical protein [Bacteroidales bacterium]
MKTINTILALAFAATSFVAQVYAQSIKTPSFAQPLVQQWITLYNEANPEVAVSLAGKQDTPDIQVVVSEKQGSQLGQNTVTFGRFAILPFAAEGSKAAQAFGHRRLSKTRLSHIYFNLPAEEDEFGDYLDANKGMTIYAGNSQASVANAFAEFFGVSATAFRGKRIQGDDRFVNLAVSRDETGLSFNALANLFDLETRQLRQGIQLLNPEASREVQKALEEGNLDQILTTLEESKNEAVATSDIRLSYDANNVEASRFVAWVLSEGVKYNHQFGLLNNEVQLQANK